MMKQSHSNLATERVRRFGTLLYFAGWVALGGHAEAQPVGSLVWRSGPDLPSPRAESVAVLAPDNAVVLLGGVSPEGAKVVPKFPNGAAVWTFAPKLDTTRIAPGAVRYSAQGILVMGGRSGNEPTDEVLLYDYYSGDSQDAEKMSTPRHQFAFAADGSGRTYALGGSGNPGQVLSSAERYDPAQDAWDNIAPLPAARYGVTAVGVGTTHIYLFGGATTDGVQANAYRYTIASDAWEPIPAMPVAVRNGVAVLSQNRIYVTGGFSSSGPVASVQMFDLATGLWAMDTPLPAPRYAHGAVIGALGEILVAGGYDAAGLATVTVYQSQRLNIPETAPTFNSTPVTMGSLDRAYGYDAGASGNPAPAFSLVSAPADMSVDPVSGLVTWQPVEGQVGTHTVTVRATNRAGYADQTFNILVVSDTIPPTAPTEVHVVDVTAESVHLAWSGATDATGVDHYGVYRRYRCGFRGIKRCYALVQGDIPASETTIGGLPGLTSYSYVVRAFDAAGNPSPNSMLVSFRTLSPPISFRYAGATSLPANFPLQLQFYVNANPAASFSVLSAPQGLTVDPDSGLAAWVPSPEQVGTHTLMMRAENSGGAAELSVSLTVRPDVPQLSVRFIPGTDGLAGAVAGSPWAAQVLDGSRTPSTFEILSAPPGMTIEAATGLLAWLPTVDDAGQQSVTVRARNAASTADIRFEFYCHFTGPISNVEILGLTDLNPTATWSPPVGDGADRVAGYTVVASARYRYGRAWRSQRLTYETDGADPTITLTGLTTGRTYTLYVNAVDEADNRGPANTPGVPFVPRPGLPSVGWTISNANGGSSIVAEQEVVLQLTNYNTAFGTASYSPVLAPAGFVLDPVTGQGRWTPAATDVGTVSVTIRVTNQIGSKDVTVNMTIYFSGPVLNAAASRNGNSAVGRWEPPSDNVLPVASYRVTMHWQWGSRSYSRALTAAGTSVPIALVPTGAVWHKGIKITPLDAEGRLGVSTPLIPYNGALPAELPPAEPVWIERIAMAPDAVPCLEVRGLEGLVFDVEVSDDMAVWETLETLTIGEDGTTEFPDPEGKNYPRGYYRLKIP